MFSSAVVSKANAFGSKMLSNLHTGRIIIFNELSSQKTPKAPKSSQSTKSAEKPTSSSSSSVEVPGLSSKVINFSSSDAAAKKGEYKNPEYFCYNATSFFEAEIEMSKYRIPQPSAKTIAPPQ